MAISRSLGYIFFTDFDKVLDPRKAPQHIAVDPARPMIPIMEQWPIVSLSPDPWDTDYQFRRWEQLVVDVPAWLRHRNVNGEVGARLVRVVRLAPYGSDFEIATYEEPGRVFHTFLASRILEFVDLSTGEKVSDIVTYLSEIHRRSVSGQVFLVLRQLSSEMCVFKAVGQASGSMREKQRAPVLAYARRAFPELQIDAERFGSDLSSLSGLEGPSIAVALKLVAAKGPDTAADVLEVAEVIAATRTGSREATDKVMVMVRRALRARGVRRSGD